MTTQRIRLSGGGARGIRIDGGLLRDLLDVLVDGCQQAVRLRVEGRSSAHGKPPVWLTRAATFDVVGGLREGSTVLLIEAPSLADAAPERFSQADLFEFVEPARSCLDLLEESLRDALEGKPDSDVYDDGLIKTFEGFSRVLRQDVEALEFMDGRLLRVDLPGIETCRRLRSAIPPDQRVRVAGKLDVLRHSDRMFMLVLESGVQARGVVASDAIELRALAGLWGRTAVVSGLAKFRPSGSLLRVEAERIEPAGEHDVALWGTLPRPIFGPLDERSLRQPQGPRTGVGAILGQLPGEESDEEIIEALERLS
ncbi:MAG TPA: hypothetical protein DCQ64_21835 [Candidatus Rokubacteria bacterium]|nr:MAG: hypothetical protein A2X53_15675 [Candidatus Rokubacteria bacterium GWA2_70_23]HAM57904.1 hypothetical protein [Candidatus Rokubacteria bacterium]